MRRLILCLLTLSVSLSVFCQTHIEEGDACFERSDYACAVAKYKAAFASSNGKDRQIADLKRGKAENCQQWIETANQAFASKEYTTAKTEYQKVLESNPQDEYAAKQIEKCNNALKPLRKATTAELTDIWNNKYETSTVRRQNLIDAGIDPDDAQKRINQGEGKPVTGTPKPTTTTRQATTLSTSTTNVLFNATGGQKNITVTTNASSYNIYSLPTWCTAMKYSSYFVLTCNPNYGSSNRNDWFKVKAGNEEVKIVVQQSGRMENNSNEKGYQSTNLNVSKGSIYINSRGGKSEKIRIFSNAGTYSISLIPSWCTVKANDGYIIVSCNANSSNTYRQEFIIVKSGSDTKVIWVTQGGENDYFNSPKTNDAWGLTLGYIHYGYAEGFQLGVKFEPLFKYGFGLNTGINLEAISYKNYNDYLNVYYDALKYSINIPMHLEYRLNFSESFNIFFYGGLGLNVVTKSSFDNYELPVTFEYGGGFRVNHVQFNIGKSQYIGDLENFNNIGRYNQTYQKYAVSISYMF